MIIPIEKTVHHIIEACNNLKEEAAYYVLNDEEFLKDSTAIVCYNNNDFKIQILSTPNSTNDEFDNLIGLLNGQLKLRKDDQNFVIKTENITSVTQTLSDPFIITYFANSLVVSENELQHKLNHVALMELNNMPNFSAFPIKAVKINSVMHYKFFETQINGVTYDCYCHENKDLKKVYLFIESMDEIYFEEFEECADVILHCIAIFNGDWYKDDIFIYSYKTDDKLNIGYKSLQYRFVGKSLLGNYKICDSHKCSEFLKQLLHIENVSKLCSGMESDVISLISSRIYKNSKIKRIIELIIEGTCATNLVLKASIYSIAIETLANIIILENEDATKTIKNKKLAEEILHKLLKVIHEYETFLNSKSIQILTKKINDINKPTNIDKLAMSFSILGVKLNKHDNETLKSRNIFLHGSTPFRNFEIDKNKKNEFVLMITKLRLLIIILLLKYLGYKGHVFNNYGYFKFQAVSKIVEPFVRLI